MTRAEPDIIVPPGDAKKGAKIFKTKCFQCHTIEEGGATKQGPNLHGIIGREAGTVKNFQYSTANKTSGIAWSEKHLWQYLVDPKGYIPGTKMVFAGIKQERDRADLIQYMASFPPKPA